MKAALECAAKPQAGPLKEGFGDEPDRLFNSPHPLFRRLVRSADAALEAEGMKVVSKSVATLTPDERRAAAEWARARRQ